MNEELQFLFNSISPFSRKNLSGGEMKKGKASYWSIVPFLMLLITSCSGHDAPIIPDYRIANFEVIASEFTIPWGIEVIGEDDYLFTERLGSLFRYKDGIVTQISNIPNSNVYSVLGGLMLGGLMDASVHPQFDSNNMVYLAYV
ncbi:MAG: PQQ-dependent sugar dehydrogenase, partial [Candidatus Tectomicrobia bacterium]|nr:PQQ-dependent sugar dehydrogenase [Candidatus Tectomicrobia bacterium]